LTGIDLFDNYGEGIVVLTEYVIIDSATFVRPDRDVAITLRSLGTSSGIEQGQRKAAL